MNVYMYVNMCVFYKSYEITFAVSQNSQILAFSYCFLI